MENMKDSEFDFDQDPGPQKKKKTTHKKRDCIALDEDQEKELLELAYATNYKHGLIIELACNTSLRVNELCNLIVPNFIYKKNESYIQIRDRQASEDNDSFKCKSDKSNRKNPILDQKLALKIKDFIGNRTTGYIFQSQVKKVKDGDEIVDKDFPVFDKKSLINMINEYAKKTKSIGKACGFHATRRAFASKCISKGIPIDQISYLLGHNSIQTTWRYIRSIRRLDLNLIRNKWKE